MFGAGVGMAVPLFASDQGIYRDIPDVSPGPHRHDRAMSEPNNGATKRVYRIRDGRVVAGVCAGLAAYFGVDATLVRLAFALLTAFGGLGVLLYLGAWVVIPDEVDGTSIAEAMVSKRRS
jgi:phage shock protein C